MKRKFDGVIGVLVTCIVSIAAMSMLAGCGGGGEAEASDEAQAAAPKVALDVTLTQEASQAIAKIMRDQKLEGGYYVRVGLKKNNPGIEKDYRGYVLDLTQNQKTGDVWADSEGFRLIAQPADAEALRGYVIDYSERGKIGGFVFMEP